MKLFACSCADPIAFRRAETVKEAAGTTAQSAQDLAQSAFDAVMGGGEKK